MSIENTIKKLIMRSRSSVDRSFIPPTVFEIEPSSLDKNPCVQYLSWEQWRTHPKVREVVAWSCPKCAQVWSPACDTFAKGFGLYDSDLVSFYVRREPNGFRIQVLVGLEPTPECPSRSIVYYQDETGPGFPWTEDRPNWGMSTTAHQRVYTPDEWYGPGGYPSMGGIWVTWVGEAKAQEIMRSCAENATPAPQCRFWVDGAAGVGEYAEDGVGGPSNIDFLIHHNCIGVSSCCSPAGDFGGFECSQNTTVQDCAARGGVFHQGKSCEQIGNDNCGGA